MKSKDNRELWISRVNDFKSSQLTQVAWCEQSDVKVGALRYWIGKLSSEGSDGKEDSKLSGFEFASVSIAQESSPSLTLEVGDVKLLIADDFDEQMLIKVIKILRKL